jgi:DNA-binding CsgD family transcriptional regulator/tetratricopeptide (TPR) repeat protein
MTAELLERNHCLSALDTALRRTADGRGQIAIISGEAGIGKTSVVERFTERHRPGARLLWGECDALFTPRPLGPVYDIARQAPALRPLLDGEAGRQEVFSAVLDELATGPFPTILVIEDIHWADEVTLDLIKFLARRVHRMPVCLLLTYRDDELARDHPLRLVLGDLPAREAVRIALEPLTESAVAALARQTRRSPQALMELTGGNPFYVTELLASDTSDTPRSVADAVLARMARLAPHAQPLLDLVAVAPSGLERKVLASLGADHDAMLETCLDTRLLRVGDGIVQFRHELARRALEDAISPGRRQALHSRILRALLGSEGIEPSLARLAHHAAFAEDAAQVLRFAPQAARQAEGRGAHREAIAHYRTAIKYSDRMAPETCAGLLEALATALFDHGRFPEAGSPITEALEIWRELEQPEQVGRALVSLSRLDRVMSRPAAANEHAREAVEILEALPPGQELARAYANLAGLRMVASDNAQTMFWGGRAIELAQRLRDSVTECAALNSIGSAQWCAGDETGRFKLERSLRLAHELRADSDVLRAYSNLAETAAKHREYELASTYVDDGLKYSSDRDLDELIGCLRDTRARIYLDRGDWSAADEEATALLGTSWRTGPDRIGDLVIIGQLRARRGDPGVAAALDQARELADVMGEMQLIAPVCTARAEWRWLQRDLEGCRDEAASAFQLAYDVRRPWDWGEAAVWLWRAGGLDDAPEHTPEPFALEIAGDWRAAAAAWEQLGCPYERALALMEGDETAQRTALSILEGMGAAPAAAIVRQRLREAGARDLPRGPRPATQANPHGLTPRQLEILLLLAEGLHNTEIANQLSTTPKTVEHHVSAVLAKLQVRSRADAVRAAYRLGLVTQAVPSVSAGTFTP